MYNNKTTKAMKIIIKLCYIGLALLIIGLWGFTQTVWFEVSDQQAKNLYCFYPALITILSPLGYIALVYIDKLLSNVINDVIFEASTIKYIDIISIACVVASIITVASLIIFICRFGFVIFSIIAIMMLALGAMFMAFLLKVIKNVFCKAIELKEENDLTI